MAHGLRCAFRVSLWCSSVLSVLLSGLAAEPDRPLTGRELFCREWMAGDVKCPDGDGLGPSFNATSCVGCHHQSGTGGGGDNEHDVELLTIASPSKHLLRMPVSAPPELSQRVEFFRTHQSGGVLHKFSTNSEFEFFRFSLFGLKYDRSL